MQTKLDEILRALDKARVEFGGIEHLTGAQICELRDALKKTLQTAMAKERRLKVRSSAYSHASDLRGSAYGVCQGRPPCAGEADASNPSRPSVNRLP